MLHFLEMVLSGSLMTEMTFKYHSWSSASSLLDRSHTTCY